MAMHLKEGKLETISQLAEITENYIEAHASDIVFGIDPKSSERSTAYRQFHPNVPNVEKLGIRYLSVGR